MVGLEVGLVSIHGSKTEAKEMAEVLKASHLIGHFSVGQVGGSSMEEVVGPE